MKNLLVGMLAVLLLVPAANRLSAEETDRIQFDIFEQDGTLVVWTDFAPLISSRRVAQLKDGIDQAVEYRLALYRPRRLWGAEKITQATGAYQLGYGLVTEDFRLSALSDQSTPDRTFLSLADLHGFLTDSVEIPLLPMDSLDPGQQYFIRLSLTCIALTSLNIADGDEAAGSTSSPIRWLFKGFLDLTNFGRQDYEVTSRFFSPTEISSGN